MFNESEVLTRTTRSVAGPEIQLYSVVHAASATAAGSIARSIGSSTSATALGSDEDRPANGELPLGAASGDPIPVA